MVRAYGTDLYIISAGELTKIGRSKHCLKRLQEIARGMPWSDCRLIATFPALALLSHGSTGLSRSTSDVASGFGCLRKWLYALWRNSSRRLLCVILWMLTCHRPHLLEGLGHGFLLFEDL